MLKWVPVKTMRWPNVGLTLANRLRRWPNISPTLCQHLVLAGLYLSLYKVADTTFQYQSIDISYICIKEMDIFFVDIDDCVSSSCQHGGTCRDGINLYNCDCVLGYEGKYCETSELFLFEFKCLNTK